MIYFDNNSFKEATSKSGVVLVDFWATWCGPCRMISPAIEQLATEYEGRAIVGKVDVDTQSDLAMQFGVMSIPTVVILKDGVEVDRKVGAMPKAVYAAALDRVL